MVEKGCDVRLVKLPEGWAPDALRAFAGAKMRVLEVLPATTDGGFLGMPTPAAVRVYRKRSYYVIPLDCVERIGG